MHDGGSRAPQTPHTQHTLARGSGDRAATVKGRPTQGEMLLGSWDKAREGEREMSAAREPLIPCQFSHLVVAFPLTCSVSPCVYVCVDEGTTVSE